MLLMEPLRDYVDISLPKEAADSYYMNKSKDLVDAFIYIDPEWYNRIFEPETFYILGPKGSGKTLYAAYMCADIRNDTISKSHTIDVSDYGKLIRMKTSNHLDFTDYLTMWKVILLQKLLLGLDAKEISFWGRAKNYKNIQDTISQYYGYDVTDDSFNPVTVIDSCGKQNEVTNYLKGQYDSQLTTDVLQNTTSYKNGTELKSVKSAGKSVETIKQSYTDVWLRALDAFQKILEKITFKYNHYLFVDGLDVRPNDIDAMEYGECIGALVRAVYDLNIKVLGNLERKDEHEFKIIALTRTDIFLNSNLVNVTSCIHDNCVELDWTYSNEKEFPYSKLYKMMNRVLGWDGTSPVMPVDHYFGFKLKYPSSRPLQASMYIQRQSRLRPRDVIVMLRLIQHECKTKQLKSPTQNVFDAPELIARYSNYYTDQVKSEMMFSYTQNEIKSIFDLVKMIRASSFKERYFATIFNHYCEKNRVITTKCGLAGV